MSCRVRNSTLIYDIATFGTTNVAPVVDVSTNPISADIGGEVTISSTIVDGQPPYAYQWYSVVSGVTSAISGATNSSLVLTGLLASQSSAQYFVKVSNTYGTGASASASLNLLSGAPTLVLDVSPPLAVAPVGASVTLSVTATGTEPFQYQWLQNGTAISGATAASYSLDTLAGTNSYSVTIRNSAGSISSSTEVLVGVSGAPTVVNFTSNVSSWSFNQSSSWPGQTSHPGIVSNVLTTTDGVNSEACSAFYTIPQYIGGFIAAFTYQEAPGSTGVEADGTTFCLENSTNASLGTTYTAIGGGGGDLGYVGISPSAALALNLYEGDHGGQGYLFVTGGNVPDSDTALGNYLKPEPLNLNGGDPIYVPTLLYPRHHELVDGGYR